MNQLDATSVIYYHKSTLHVSGIYMPIFKSTCCNLLHVVFNTVRENLVWELLNLTGFVEPNSSSGSIQPSFDVLVCVDVFGLFGTTSLMYV
jgi:hypothetical protein